MSIRLENFFILIFVAMQRNACFAEQRVVIQRLYLVKNMTCDDVAVFGNLNLVKVTRGSSRYVGS